MSSHNKRKASIAARELTLALNASEGRLQIVLGRSIANNAATDKGGESTSNIIEPGKDANLDILAFQDWSAVAQGAELLTPALQQMLLNLKLEPFHIGRVAVVTGPGSFTGLRLVCTTASALAHCIGAEIASMDLLAILAAEAMQLYSGEQFAWVATHARKELVYTQLFGRGGKKPEVWGNDFMPEVYSETSLGYLKGTVFALNIHPLTSVQVLGVSNAVSLIKKYAGLLIGSGIGNNFSAFAGLDDRCILPAQFEQPTPYTLLKAAINSPILESEPVPFYVRASDAEESLDQIAPKLGLDAGFAQKRLSELLKN